MKDEFSSLLFDKNEFPVPVEIHKDTRELSQYLSGKSELSQRIQGVCQNKRCLVIHKSFNKTGVNMIVDVLVDFDLFSIKQKSPICRNSAF